MAVMDYCKYRIRHYVDSPDWKRFFCSYHGCNVDCLLIQLHIWILQLEKTCCEKQQTSLTPLVFRIFTNFPSPKILQLPKSSRSIFQSNRLCIRYKIVQITVTSFLQLHPQIKFHQLHSLPYHLQEKGMHLQCLPVLQLFQEESLRSAV